jgi:cardiolipin synthase A/B
VLWILLQYALVLFAVQILLVAGFSAVRRLRRRHTELPRVPPMPPAATLRIGRSDVTLYSNGEALFADMLAAVAAAQESIYLESYIWKDDTFGRAFKAAVCARAAAGIAVYVIYDSFANLVVPRRFFDFPAAVHVLRFRAWQRPWHLFDWRRYGRDHRKILVVDRQIGFVGGYNIGEIYRRSWRDTHLRLIGPEVDDLAHAFVDFWNTQSAAHQPQLAPVRRSWSPELRAYRNDPLRLCFPIRSIYIEAIDQAQQHIYLTHAYFMPDESIQRALFRAARRGVDVRVLVPRESNHLPADWLARRSFMRFLRNGVRLFLYDGAMLHAKTATIDGVWSTVGTANVDRLSLAGNYEINLEIFSPALAAAMEQLFAADLHHAHELQPAEWQRRSWWARAGEWLLAPLWPLL